MRNAWIVHTQCSKQAVGTDFQNYKKNAKFAI